MKQEIQAIRKEIVQLKAKEAKLVLALRKELEQANGTFKLPGIDKTTWKSLPNQLHRTTVYRRKLKLK